MSLVQKLAKYEAANAELTEKVAELEAAANEQVGAIEAIGAEHEAAVAELNGQIVELTEANATQKEAIEAAEKDASDAKAGLEAANIKLADPAYKDADAEGEPEAADLGEVAEPEAAEKPHSYIAEYNELEEGRARAAWLAKDDNHAKLQEEANALNDSLNVEE